MWDYFKVKTDDWVVAEQFVMFATDVSIVSVAK